MSPRILVLAGLAVLLAVAAPAQGLIKDINPNFSGAASNSSPSAITPAGAQKVYFAASNRAGRELWSSDGTAAGTRQVRDIAIGTGDSNPGNFATTLTSGITLFAATDSEHGRELWKTDGTEQGTVLLSDIFLGTGSSSPSDLYAHQGFIYFAANDGVHGRELWRSDGTTAGTFMILDIHNAGSGSSSPASFCSLGLVLLFSAFDGSGGRELWRTGIGPTARVADVEPGSGGSDPDELVLLSQNRVLFSATTTASGREL